MAYYKALLLLDNEAIDNKIHRVWAQRYNLAENVIHFTNPEKALNYLRTSDFGSAWDLMLVDVHMPYMSGPEFIQAYLSSFREAANQASIYIVTSSLSEKDARQANHLPLQGYLIKPLLEEHLQQIIDASSAWKHH